MPAAPAPITATRFPERGACRALSGVCPASAATDRASCALVQGSGEANVDGVEKPLAYASSAAIATGAPKERRWHAVSQGA
jgi:hypothetical protein